MHSSGTNSEMLLLLAWVSTSDVRELARQDRQERPWKYKRFPGQDRPPCFPKESLQAQIAQALSCFGRDPMYGPVFTALAQYRLLFIDWDGLSWAIHLEELADPSWAFFFSDKPSSVERQQESEVLDETDAFWRVVCSHVPLRERLERLRATWQGEGDHGAVALRWFFFQYLDLMGRPLQMPFFLVEYVRQSLLNINWHTIAENLLAVPPVAGEHSDCPTSIQAPDSGSTAEYLGELFNVTGEEVPLLAPQLPEPERTHVLFMSDLCRETTNAMHLFLHEENEEESSF